MEKLVAILIFSQLFYACSKEEIDLKQGAPNILVLIADDAGYISDVMVMKIFLLQILIN